MGHHSSTGKRRGGGGSQRPAATDTRALAPFAHSLSRLLTYRLNEYIGGWNTGQDVGLLPGETSRYKERHTQKETNTERKTQRERHRESHREREREIETERDRVCEAADEEQCISKQPTQQMTECYVMLCSDLISLLTCRGCRWTSR